MLIFPYNIILGLITWYFLTIQNHSFSNNERGVEGKETEKIATHTSLKKSNHSINYYLQHDSDKQAHCHVEQ